MTPFLPQLWPQALSLGYFSSWVHLNHTLRTLTAYSGGRFSAVSDLSYILPRGNKGGKCKWNPWLVCKWWLGQEYSSLNWRFMGKSDPQRVSSGEMCSATPIGQENDDSLLLETMLACPPSPLFFLCLAFRLGALTCWRTELLLS